MVSCFAGEKACFDLDEFMIWGGGRWYPMALESIVMRWASPSRFMDAKFEPEHLYSKWKE